MRSPSASTRTNARRSLGWASSIALIAGLLACGGSTGDAEIGSREGFLVGEVAAQEASSEAAATEGDVEAPSNVCTPSDGDDEESDGDDEESDGDDEESDGDDEESDGDDEPSDGDDSSGDDECIPAAVPAEPGAAGVDIR